MWYRRKIPKENPIEARSDNKQRAASFARVKIAYAAQGE